MVQQSNTEPRGTEKRHQGSKTREQQRAVSQKREKTKGADVDPHEQSLEEAGGGQQQPVQAYDMSSGERSIRRGANQESEHNKRRSEH